MNRPAAFLAALAVAACAVLPPGPRLVPGASTEADVRSAFGAPTAIYPEPGPDPRGGGRWLQFGTQPYGGTVWNARLGPDGVLRELFDGLAPEGQARIRAGLTPDEVLRVLGRPRTVQQFRGLGETVWDWRLPPELSGQSFFNVHFGPDGRVLKTSRSYESYDRRRPGAFLFR